MSPPPLLAEAAEACAALRIDLIMKAKTKSDALAIATAFVIEAETIYRRVSGGSRGAAAYFYLIADRLATEDPRPGD